MVETEQNKITFDIEFLKDIEAGLTSDPKTLPSRYFYDEVGDKLFQAIMKLPEYYLARSEFEILKTYKSKLLEYFSQDVPSFQLMELGAGDGIKTRLLIEEFIESKAEFEYRPIDISQHALDGLKNSFQKDYPELKIKPVNDEYFSALKYVDTETRGRKVILFMGANIGNFTQAGAVKFLNELRERVNPEDFLVIGFDLKKDPDLILAAYNDAAGVTRDFNLNLLERMNRELQADFDLSRFKHFPTYHPVTGETKSYLVSTSDQKVNIGVSGLKVMFKAWEAVQTEVSLKYSPEGIIELARQTGFKEADRFYDAGENYVVSLWRPNEKG